MIKLSLIFSLFIGYRVFGQQRVYLDGHYKSEKGGWDYVE